jgi:hypothetical protein
MKEFEEAYCDRCMCREWATCARIEIARVWIRTHGSLIGTRFFEDVATDYPGAFRPFMLAWCDEFGGI